MEEVFRLLDVEKLQQARSSGLSNWELAYASKFARSHGLSLK